MNIVFGALVIVATTTVAVAAMLLVRRRAPEGSYFADGDRASGVFGVLATGFSVLLGFIVFLAFTSYDASRAGAEDEAIVVAQQVETAQGFTQPAAAELTGQLVCYARSVINDEWDRMEDGTLDESINAWAPALFQTVQGVEPETNAQQSAYDKWLDETSEREQARNDRVHGAAGVIPTPLWFVLFFISGVIFVYMLFFADRGERAITQAVLMGSVAAVITSLMLLLGFLDSPFHGDVGGLQPDAMERTVRVIEQELDVVGGVEIPCDEKGMAR